MNSEQSLSIRAAWLAYVGGHTQEQIAKRLRVSRIKAQRLIAAATQNGLVKFFVEGVPADIQPGTEGRILQELIDQYREYQQAGIHESRDNLAKSFGCRAAIKTGQRLTVPEMRSLIDQLFAAEMPYVCPHGRPTIIKISVDELDKRFGRTS